MRNRRPASPPLAAFLVALLAACALPADGQVDAAGREKENVLFIRNSYHSILRREPATGDYDRWLKFLKDGGEKSGLARDLKDTDEYLRINKPAGMAARLTVTVHARPEATSLRVGTLMPGDKFQVTGRENAFYRVVFGTAAGYVERDAIDVVFGTRKIAEAEEKGPADRKAELDKLYSDLTVARSAMLDSLLMDGRSYLYQLKPGRAVAGEKARERYLELLNRFVIARKVEATSSTLEFRGALVDPRDADLLKYELPARLDRLQRLGVNALVLRFFVRGETPGQVLFYHRSALLPWKTLFDRYAEEAKRRGLELYAVVSGFDFGPPFAREEPDLLALNGIGFGSERYLPGGAWADPILPEARAHLFELIKAATTPPDLVKGIFLTDLFHPVTPDLPSDIRALFCFNKRTVKAFEADTGLNLSGINAAQETILMGWLRSAMKEFFAELRRVTDARSTRLIVAVPEAALAPGPMTIATYRECPADAYLVTPDQIERFGFSVPGKVILAFDRARTGEIEAVEAATLAAKEKHPRVTGWLIEP